jgi:uncharacterized protein with ParB-like and HNH nuclease domain
MKVDNLSISKVFSNGGDIHYILPHFQREYTWGKGEWQTLLDDAVAVCDEMRPLRDGESDPMPEHFMGTIVVAYDSMRAGTLSALKLVDGQQRLVSISLLLRAMIVNLGPTHPQLAKKTEKLLLNGDEHGDLHFKILPTVKYGDRVAYCAVLTGAKVPACSSKIPEAYHYFERTIATRAKEGLNLETLLQVIVSAFQVVFVNLEQRESPYRIFESLNAKGKELTPADLVRNYVAMKLPSARQERVFTSFWSETEDLLHETRMVGRLPELTAFLRHYLAMKTGVLCAETHVYARFRDRAEKEFADPASFEVELATIARFAVIYDGLLRPHKISDRKIGNALARLNVLEIATGYPFLLRLLDELSSGHLAPDAALEALGILENYMVRRFAAGEPASYLNRMFVSLWDAIVPSRIVETMRTALATRNYPSNNRLLQTLKTRRLYEKNQQTRLRTGLILETMNRRLSEGSGGYTVLDGAPTIEHILPQSLSSAWKEHLGLMSEQIHKDNVHTLGNLTLITGEWNSELSNATFDIKRPKLAAHALRLNSSYFAAAGSNWTRDEIQERTETLSDLLLSIWPSFAPADIENQGEGKGALRESVSEFNFEVVERIATRIGTPLLRLSQSRYESTDGKIRLVGLCSKPYLRPDGGVRYWYGVRPTQRSFLEGTETSWLAFECAPHGKCVLIPFGDFQPWLSGLSMTEGQHWHVDLIEQEGRLHLPLPRSREDVDVSKYLI